MNQQKPDDLFEAAREFLRDKWGYPDFRPGQDEVIRSVLSGTDTLAILPTGGGKSITYQVPSQVLGGLTLVITPLIALMKDQLEGLQRRGIAAAALHSQLKRYEIEQIWTNAEFGGYKLLYLSPERLQTDEFRARADRLKVSLIAVDEAHCISDWGDHFRPSYRQIAEAKELLGNPPVLAVTATATPAVRRDIRTYLHLESPNEIVRGFDRPNIRWAVFETNNKPSRVQDVLKGVPGSGIVYAATRKGVDEWKIRLHKLGISAEGYHAGLPAAERNRVQEAWIKGNVRCMVATNAFGMGIDKPDVRWVIHADLPGSLEAYYQEAGRAGRDGKGSYAVLLWQRADEQLQRTMLESGMPDVKAVRSVYETICNLGQVAVGTLPDEAIWIDPVKIAEITRIPRSKVRSSIEILENQEIFQVMSPRRNYVSIRMVQSVESIRAYADDLKKPRLREFIRNLLRSVHADAFVSWHEVNIRLLERNLGIPKNRMEKGFDFLQERGFLRWQNPDRGARILLVYPRTKHLRIEQEALDRARKRAEYRLKEMVRYATSMVCRRYFLLSYFGERSKEKCGSCDVCLGRHKPPVVTRRDEPALRRILSGIAEGENPTTWASDLGKPAHYIEGLLYWLFAEGLVDVSDPMEGVYELTETGKRKLTS